jgi:phosphoglycerol transferase MdoB-like AlkP superfamily enzyme
MLFLGSGNAPYQQYIHDETEALPSFLNEVYESYAIHPANPSSWSRNVAYPLIGFKEFISIDNTVFDNASYCRWWIDDQSLYDVVENMYEEIEQPVFIFGLTIQCHGGYTYENFENTVEVLNMSKSYDDVNQYLSLVKSTDDGFGNLLENISESDEPTIVLMFGDHLPSLDTDFYAELSDNQEYDERDEKLLKYETPYIIWANYDVDLSDIPDVISVNFLAPYLLNAAGIKLDGFYQYLYDLSQMYPVISRSGIMDAEGNLYDYSEDSACYDAVHTYEMVQYYRLFGK